MQWINGYYDEIEEVVKRDISSMNEEDLIATDTDKLAAYYCKKYQLPIIEKDPARTVNIQKGKAVIENHRKYVKLSIEIPILPKENIETVLSRMSSSYQTGPHEFPQLKDPGTVVLEEYMEGETPEHVQSMIKRALDYFDGVMGRKNDNVNHKNQELQIKLKQYIERKKSDLSADFALLEKAVENINVTLKKKSAEEIPGYLFTKKKSIELIQKPLPSKLRVFVLPREKVDEVIRVIDSQSTSFEQTPKLYAKADETELRDVLLSGLNGIFEGKGTAEAFNKKGKTDIRLIMPEGQILVIECKIWDGEKYYLDAIDQLLSYLTWKESWGILITFSKKKNFTEIIEKSKVIVKKHATYIEDSFFEDKTRPHAYNTKHHLVKDTDKKVEIYNLFFDVNVE